MLVLYYSAYGHVEKMAHGVAEGARQARATVDIAPSGKGSGLPYGTRV
jgi:hypothetical protein